MMSSMKQLNPKALRLALKRPDGVEYLMRRFEFVSEDELMSAIRKMNPEDANEFIKTLKKKQRKYTVSEEADAVHFVQEIPVSVEEEYSALDEEIADAVGAVEANVNEKGNTKELLAALCHEEETLSVQVCALESEHKELAAKRHDLRGIFREADSVLAQLEEKVATQKEIVQAAYVAYQACAQAMKVNDEEQRLYKLMLEDVRDRREALERVTIFIYEDGSFSIENAKIPDVEMSVLREETNRLLDMPEAESFTVKTVKNIARLCQAVSAFDRKAELVFDSLELQIFWETVVNAV